MDILLIIFISMAMFSIGVVGVLARRNALIFILSIELMLNAANLLFVAFAYHWGNQIGLMWVFFVLVVAAAEAAVGLAIMIHLFRTKQGVDVDQFNTLRG
ncbi:NADH-quinone oxidoreductase subunit NuoK [Parachlamydia sp. AcF125]|uniref:NADH-quinone oxidoreductase subunit NuoK n=1 Tax=Parachlamydia sp. AcF125 TaxID=2795736 RepID=UPI001BC99156|nr:NADH-quinone oxidoreductase subunit NuoK [Parachlamydia sp. AcF125]MBS4167687.1 NADH-quinone oxidoreductase subunit K [Parachlamydia sp. AcF125]